MSKEHLTYDDVLKEIFSKEQLEAVDSIVNRIIDNCFSKSMDNFDLGFSMEFIRSELYEINNKYKLINSIKKYLNGREEVGPALGFTSDNCVNILTFDVFFNLWPGVIDKFIRRHPEIERKKGYVSPAIYVSAMADIVTVIMYSVNNDIRNSVDKFASHMSSYAIFTSESALQLVCESSAAVESYTHDIYRYVVGIIGGCILRNREATLFPGSTGIDTLSTIINRVKGELTVDRIVNDIASTEYIIRLPRTYAKSRSVIELKMYVQDDNGVADAITVKAFKNQ